MTDKNTVSLCTSGSRIGREGLTPEPHPDWPLAPAAAPCYSVGSRRSEIELMQYRWSVGVG